MKRRLIIMVAMKESTRQVMEAVRANEGKTAKEIAEIMTKALGVEVKAASVNGSFTSFVKKGWGFRKEELIPGGVVKYLCLTDEGRAVDLDAACNPDAE